MHTFLYNVHIMKSRVTLTLDPKAVRKAKSLAHYRKLSMSGLVEDLVLTANSPTEGNSSTFVEKWAGSLKLNRSRSKQPRYQALKKKYGL